jgi:DNA-binding LacI/PurR family transcriptional regulator
VGLNGGKTHTIGLVWSLGGPHGAGETTHDITWRMQKHGYRTHLAEHGDDPRITADLLADFSRRHVDAIILQNNNSELEEETILRQLEAFPAALMVSSLPPAEGLNIDHLHHDRLPAYVQAAEHFAQSGRHRPAVLGVWPSAKSKSRAFFDQARRHGMEIGAGAEIGTDGKVAVSVTAACRRALEKRFDGHDFPFDALMCTSDEYAIVAIDFLRRQGLRVPQDVAVAGFNDSLFAPYCAPPLASGNRRDEEVAAAIEEMILRRLDHPELPPQRQYIPARFIWRESAGGKPQDERGGIRG